MTVQLRQPVKVCGPVEHAPELVPAPPGLADPQMKEEASQPEDSVRLYLSEIGMVPLLDKEGEVHFARTMARGERRACVVLSRSSWLWQELRDLRSKLKAKPADRPPIDRWRGGRGQPHGREQDSRAAAEAGQPRAPDERSGRRQGAVRRDGRAASAQPSRAQASVPAAGRARCPRDPQAAARSGCLAHLRQTLRSRCRAPIGFRAYRYRVAAAERFRGPQATARPAGRTGPSRVRQAVARGGEPEAGRLGGEEVRQPWTAPARSDPRGQHRLDPRSREVRLSLGLQVLDVRHLVDTGRRSCGHSPTSRGRCASRCI